MTTKRYDKDVRAAAQYLSLSPTTIYRLVGAGQLTYLRAGNRMRFSVEDLEEWKARQVVPALVAPREPVGVAAPALVLPLPRERRFGNR
jgi:excisionase family DNA binding protein